MNSDTFCNFSASVYITNNNLCLEKIIGFDIITLIGNINSSICQDMQLTKETDSSAFLTVVLNHFFEDLGCPQIYIQSLINLHKTIQNEMPIYIFSLDPNHYQQTNNNHIIPDQCIQAFVENAECVVECISIHKLKISVNFKIDPNQLEHIPPFATSFINTLTLKMLNSLKKCIENI